MAGRGANKKKEEPEPRKRSATGKLLDTAGLPILAVQTARERLNGFLLPWAWRVGWLGMSALVVCGALAILDPAHWPTLGGAELDEDHLAPAAVGSLVFASLVGWGCMQVGMRRVRKAVGMKLGGYLFVVLPVFCALLVLAQVRGWIDVRTWPAGEWVHPFARFYTPLLVAIGLTSYLLQRLTAGKEEDDRTRRLERGLWLLLVLAPYALLMTHLALGADVPWLADPLEDALRQYGTAALVIQVVLAYFVTASAAG